MGDWHREVAARLAAEGIPASADAPDEELLAEALAILDDPDSWGIAELARQFLADLGPRYPGAFAAPDLPALLIRVGGMIRGLSALPRVDDRFAEFATPGALAAVLTAAGAALHRDQP